MATPWLVPIELTQAQLTALSRNARHGKQVAVSKQVKGVRTLARYATLAAVPAAERQPDRRVDIHVILYPPTAAHRDPDGVSGIAKPCIDGLADVALLDDSDRHVRQVTFEVGPVAPRGRAGQRRAVLLLQVTPLYGDSPGKYGEWLLELLSIATAGKAAA